MDKNIINFDDTELEEHKFHQHKSSILIIIKEQYPISFLLVNNNLNISWVTKIIKKLDLYSYSLQKCTGIEIREIWIAG